MPNYCFRTTFIATLLFDSILVHSQLLCSIEKAVWKLAQSCPSTEANMYHYKMTATYRASIHSFMKKDPKREKHDSKWPYMAPNDLKWAKNDPKWPKNDILISGGPTWDQKWSEMGKKWPKMTLYGPKWPKKDQKWLKIAQKWHFDIWGDHPRTEISKKLQPAFFNFWRRGTVSEISAKKRNFGSERGHKTFRETINWASRNRFFFACWKRVPGACFGP